MDSDIRAAHDACTEHASDLLRSAEALLAVGVPHIAYHLATLALEETGKAGMITSRSVVSGRKNSDWMSKRLDDHEWKLAWALWTPAMASGRIDPKDFEDARAFAKSIHTRRLSALYFPHDAKILPKDNVTPEQVVSLINLARARLEIEKSHHWGEATAESQENLDWFIATTIDPHESRKIFNATAIERLQAHDGDVNAWISELRSNIAAENRRLKELIDVERTRDETTGEAAQTPRWRIRVKLLSATHTIRPKVLTDWNKHDPSFQLMPLANDKKAMLIDATLPALVPMDKVFEYGWDFFRVFTIGLNIATSGLFWWELPSQTDRYYEHIRDLQTDLSLEIRQPSWLSVWVQRALSEEDVLRANHLTFALQMMNPGQMPHIFGQYLSGLAFLSKSNLHHSFVFDAASAFANTFSLAASHFDGLDMSRERIEASVFSALSGIFTNEERSKYVELVRLLLIPDGHHSKEQRLELRAKQPPELLLSKVVCDAYVGRRLLRAAERHLEARKTLKDGSETGVLAPY